MLLIALLDNIILTYSIVEIHWLEIKKDAEDIIVDEVKDNELLDLISND